MPKHSPDRVPTGAWAEGLAWYPYQMSYDSAPSTLSPCMPHTKAIKLCIYDSQSAMIENKSKEPTQAQKKKKKSLPD